MADVATRTIENPVINSPFKEPERHYHFTDTGITNELKPGRRKSVYFVPIPKPKQRSGQMAMDYDLNRAEENKLINDLRDYVAPWRKAGYPGVTHITRRLLDYWQRSDRERRLFFCQLEALETIIYLTELSPDAHLIDFRNRFKIANEGATPEGCPTLPRYALKMATGSGKTVVMAMLIAWQALNKFANRQSKKYADAFLIVAPGITIKDRLRVLLPHDPNNYYTALNILPESYLQELHKAKIVIINFHNFMLRERISAGKLTKTILTQGKEQNPFTETPGQMVKRVCDDLGNKKNIIVLNDEAHHCYHRKPEEALTEKLDRDERNEAKRAEEDARIWISGLEAVKQKIGVRAVYDLSATPFFLKGSGYGEGTLFPWVTSDFSMTDAIESGIVKVPRVPVADNTLEGNSVLYRNLWREIRSDLPKGRRSKADDQREPDLPKELEGAIHSLYGNYEKAFQHWQQAVNAGATNLMPPVFIVVCNNTRTSKVVFDYIAGWEKSLSKPDPNTGQTSVLVPGKLKIFSNVEDAGVMTDRRWTVHPNTLLIDSQQLESGESLSNEFKQAASKEIEEFKAELRERFPGRADEVTDEDVLREVMNTVGKPGKLGEHIKCVVSVSMLTEGWDANTVTHILGVRAFGTQLLCEQVIGRGLRRISYETEPHTVTMDGVHYQFEAFPAEYTEVYGVPFDFIPTSGGGTTIKPQKDAVQVQALEERRASMITFPRLLGYCYEFASERIRATFTDSSRMTLSTKHIPTLTESMPIVGESVVHTLDDLKRRRENEVAFLIARLILERYFRQESNGQQIDYAIGMPVQNDVKAWLFPQLLGITKRWLVECVECYDHAFKQLLLLTESAHDAANRIYNAIVSADSNGESILKPIFHPYNAVATTENISFLTRKDTYTANEKCHLSHVVLDSTWEKSAAQAFEYMEEVKAYVKNYRLDFEIPYTFEGQERRYVPDFIVRLDDGRGSDDLLNLIVEVSGEERDDKAAKVDTMQNLWIPAVNHSRQFGRWGFVEVTNPQQVMMTIREYVKQKD